MKREGDVKSEGEERERERDVKTEVKRREREVMIETSVDQAVRQATNANTRLCLAVLWLLLYHECLSLLVLGDASSLYDLLVQHVVQVINRQLLVRVIARQLCRR